MPRYEPCKLQFTGLFLFSTTLVTKYPTGTRRIRNGRKQSNGGRASSLLPSTPLPSTGKHRNVLPCLGNIVCWRLALPTMLPGHGSVFLQLPHRRQALLSTPYDPISPPLHQRYRKHQNTRVVKNHPRVSCLLRPPRHSARPGMNKGDPIPPCTAEIQSKKAKTPPASPERASALPGDIGDDRAYKCARFRRRSFPWSPIGLHGEFQGCRARTSGRYTGAARVFCARSVGNYIICTVIVLYT